MGGPPPIRTLITPLGRSDAAKGRLNARAWKRREALTSSSITDGSKEKVASVRAVGASAERDSRSPRDTSAPSDRLRLLRSDPRNVVLRDLLVHSAAARPGQPLLEHVRILWDALQHSACSRKMYVSGDLYRERLHGLDVARLTYGRRTWSKSRLFVAPFGGSAPCSAHRREESKCQSERG
jgi:hypothetical protein